MVCVGMSFQDVGYCVFVLGDEGEKRVCSGGGNCVICCREIEDWVDDCGLQGVGTSDYVLPGTSSWLEEGVDCWFKCRSHVADCAGQV